MIKNKLYVLLWIGIVALTSCTEDIVMDLPKGEKVPVVEGSLTNEFTRHEVVLSYSSGLYDKEEREMIEHAEVYVTSDDDTIWYYEQEDRPGHYLTDSVAARKNRWYHLEVRVPENTLYSNPLHMYADSKMPNNVSRIDSVLLMPKHDGNNIPLVNDTIIVNVCPYFQTLSDASIVYQVQIYLNGKLFKNRPAKLMNLFPMKGYAGYYFNGPEMLENNIEVPVGIMNTAYMDEGDVVKVKLNSITEDYMYFLMGQKVAIGTNPVMGAYPAMFTNIFSNCNAIGWFKTPSVAIGEGVYHEFR